MLYCFQVRAFASTAPMPIVQFTELQLSRFLLVSYGRIDFWLSMRVSNKLKESNAEVTMHCK